MLRDLLETDEFQNHESKIAFAAGRDIAGKSCRGRYYEDAACIDCGGRQALVNLSVSIR